MPLSQLFAHGLQFAINSRTRLTQLVNTFLGPEIQLANMNAASALLHPHRRHGSRLGRGCNRQAQKSAPSQDEKGRMKVAAFIQPEGDTRTTRSISCFILSFNHIGEKERFCQQTRDVAFKNTTRHHDILTKRLCSGLISYRRAFSCPLRANI